MFVNLPHGILFVLEAGRKGKMFEPLKNPPSALGGLFVKQYCKVNEKDSHEVSKAQKRINI